MPSNIDGYSNHCLPPLFFLSLSLSLAGCNVGSYSDYSKFSSKEGEENAAFDTENLSRELSNFIRAHTAGPGGPIGAKVN